MRSTMRGTRLTRVVLGNKVHNGILIGSGTATSQDTRQLSSEVDKNFLSFFVENTATSGTSRGEYLRLYLSGAGGGGEALRAFTSVQNVAGANAHGAHISLNFGTSGSITGLGVASRNTLHLPNAAMSGWGNYAPTQAEIWSDGATTDPTGVEYLSFLRVVNDGNATGVGRVDDKANLIDLVGGSDATGNVHFGCTLRSRIQGSAKYLLLSNAENELELSRTLTSQTTENNLADLTHSTDSTFIAGTNITYSGGRGSAVLKLTGTWSATSGGYHGLSSVVDSSGNLATANDGVIGIKSVVRSTDTAVTAGSVYGGQYIAKKAGSGVAAAEAAFVGLEGWFYETGTGEVRTGIGGNFGYHADSSVSHAGGVWRGVQVFCDNTADKAAETTGICVWNMGGTQDHVINVVNSGTGFTNLFKITDDGKPAQSTSTTVTNVGARGWIKVLIGSATRYIALGDGVT